MQLGILYNNKGNYPPGIAVKLARTLFHYADHTAGHKPVAAQFHPQQQPPDETINGLAVQGNPQVPLNHIRICTAAPASADLTSPCGGGAGGGGQKPSELEQERQIFQQQVDRTIQTVQHL